MNSAFKLFILILACARPAVVQAQFTFTTNDDSTITITKYTGTNAAAIIPSMTNGYPVTSIGTNAFYNCTNLTSVTIPNSVTNIGDFAFFSCTSLPRFTIGNSVTNIGEAAFCYCTSLTNVTIGNSVANIGMGAFEACTSLTSVTIGNSVTNIGEAVFYVCTSLTNVTIPNRVTSLGYDAFGECIKLTSVKLPNSVTSIGDYAFAVCASLPSVTIPNSVTTIGKGAFEECGLTNLIIPTSVTSLGTNAFYWCTNLTAACFQGNAPPDNGTVFTNNSRATVYYLPGTTGWGATFGSRPTALWVLPCPVILSGANGNTNLGVQNKQFGFNVSWATNVPVVVLAATNLAQPVWTPVSTNALVNGTFFFNDPKWTKYPGRFYRLRSP